jgi:hypothetical protein
MVTPCFDCTLAGAFCIVFCIGMGIPCFDCILAGASCIVLCIGMDTLCFDCTLAGTFCIVLCIGMGIPRFDLLWQGHSLLYCVLVWSSLVLIVLWQKRLLFDMHFFALTKESFFLHLRGSQLFAAEF